MCAWILNNVGHLLTASSVIVGAAMMVWQINRQHRNALELQRDNAREALRLDIYKSLCERTAELSRAATVASSYGRVLSATSSAPRPAIDEMSAQIRNLHNTLSTALADVLVAIEEWRIAVPGLEIFRAALSTAHRDVQDAFVPLFATILGQPEVTNAGQGQLLTQRAIAYAEAALDLAAFASDLGVEAQNALLGGLFPTPVPRRQPEDLKHKVISTDPRVRSELEEYFRAKETARSSTRAPREAERTSNPDEPSLNRQAP